MRCPDCGEEHPDHVRSCLVCGNDLGFPNVRAAASRAEAEALKAREELALKRATARGCAHVVEEFRDITKLLDLQDTILLACSSCNRIRDKEGNWQKLTNYIRIHTGAEFSHSFCPECFRRLYPELADEMKKPTD